MKKLFFMFIALGITFSVHAATNFKADTTQKDTAKTNKKIASLKDKLADLNTQLVNTKNTIPVDSVKWQTALSKSNDALEKSKSTAKDAVGGDVSDAKKAERQARKASNAADDANDAKKQLDKDRKKVISLTKDIEKTQQKLDNLQSM